MLHYQPFLIVSGQFPFFSAWLTFYLLVHVVFQMRMKAIFNVYIIIHVQVWSFASMHKMSKTNRLHLIGHCCWYPFFIIENCWQWFQYQGEWSHKSKASDLTLNHLSRVRAFVYFYLSICIYVCPIWSVCQNTVNSNEVTACRCSHTMDLLYYFLKIVFVGRLEVSKYCFCLWNLCLDFLQNTDWIPLVLIIKYVINNKYHVDH